MSKQSPFTVVIPARFGSTRFPGKVLVDIHGKPMIQHVVERALESGAESVIVATDNLDVANVVAGLCQVVMTSSDHESGTERIAEVVVKADLSDETIIVNVQGDEPFVPAENIKQVAQLLSESEGQMATLCTPLDNREEAVNPNAVKVVANKKRHALYFSRATIPFERQALLDDISNPSNVDLTLLRRHIGIYAYSVKYIKQYVAYAPSPIEKIESLEQLRSLWYGDKISVDDAIATPPSGIDTPDDLTRLLNQLKLK